MPRWSVLMVVLATWSCGSGSARDATDTSRPAARSATGGADLTGAGATFPYPLYGRWISEYAAKARVNINYRDIGSGGGIKQLSEETVDFGATDAPMSDAEMAAAKGGPVLHFPMVAGVVAIAYNLPGVTQPLRLTGGLLVGIFMGRFTKWNDPRIAAVNPGVKLPASDILVVHRSEASGTTYVLTDYLSSISPTWKAGPGKGKQVQWPVGLGAMGNEGVAGQIKQTPGTIGYIELAYAKQGRLNVAELENASGKFVAPTAAAASAAAEASMASLPANTDFRVSIVNAGGPDTYPIVSFTWILVYQHARDAAKTKKLSDFIRWALTDGQKDAAALDYAPLPASMVTRLVPRLDSLTAGANE